MQVQLLVLQMSSGRLTKTVQAWRFVEAPRRRPRKMALKWSQSRSQDFRSSRYSNSTKRQLAHGPTSVGEAIPDAETVGGSSERRVGAFKSANCSSLQPDIASLLPREVIVVHSEHVGLCVLGHAQQLTFSWRSTLFHRTDPCNQSSRP